MLEKMKGIYDWRYLWVDEVERRLWSEMFWKNIESWSRWWQQLKGRRKKWKITLNCECVFTTTKSRMMVAAAITGSMAADPFMCDRHDWHWLYRSGRDLTYHMYALELLKSLHSTLLSSCHEKEVTDWKTWIQKVCQVINKVLQVLTIPVVLETVFY